jgi:F-type H+-transporting ATPase subunit delta
MLGDLCLVVAPLSLTPFLVFQFRTASRFSPRKAGPSGSGFGGRLKFGGFALAAQVTRVSGMAGRYAQALFALCQETGTTEKAAADLAAFAELVRSSADLQRFVKSPVFSAEEQVKALDALLAKAEIDGIAAKFIKLVAAKRRLFAIFDMIRDFNLLNDARKGVTRVDVTVAETLKPGHVEALRNALTDISGGGEVDIAIKVDPAIIGGLIVKLGSRMVDSSLKTKLNSIRSRMKEAG